MEFRREMLGRRTLGNPQSARLVLPNAVEISIVSQLRKIKGTYSLIVFLARGQAIRIGALGVFKFPRGYYLYIGSAMNGLAVRLARHLRADKKKFWHIDYLLEHARIQRIWGVADDIRYECLWAQAALAMPGARIVAPRFGASDCNCATHLIYFGKRMPDI